MADLMDWLEEGAETASRSAVSLTESSPDVKAASERPAAASAVKFASSSSVNGKQLAREPDRIVLSDDEPESEPAPISQPPPVKKSAQIALSSDEDDDQPLVPLRPSAGPSKLAASRPDGAQQEIEKLDKELLEIDEQLSALQGARKAVIEKRSRLLKSLPPAPAKPAATPRAQLQVSSGRIDLSEGGNDATGSKTDYGRSSWPWSEKIKAKLREVWNLDAFRPLQAEIINASCDGRDVVVVMPTGAGKSLTYQLPALLSKGLTVVISPLLALMEDQVWHLKERGVEAVNLKGGLSKEETKAIMERLKAAASTRKSSDIKLLFVTPEKIAQSATLRSMLNKLDEVGLLTRFVIDEAHCCSPDYRKLNQLKTIYPDVPIIAVTATCPPPVLKDLLTCLQLPLTTPGSAANSSGTVLFTAPLYRANLHYSVLPKPSNAKESLQTMADWIVEHHDNECGIVYVLSQKDTHTIADGLLEASKMKIRSAAYHAGLDDAAKERIHRRWRDGQIQVVVATTAFGLGIDATVRFVLHQSISKSLEGAYQESGRAGRDGQRADCVLFFRPLQDTSRLLGHVAHDYDGPNRLCPALAFGLDVQTCRKLLFARYFAGRALTTFAPGDDNAPCGNCDNCLRDPTTVETRDVTVDAWRVLRVVNEAVKKNGGRVTLSSLADLVRGNGGGSYNTGVGASAVKSKLDLNVVAGGKVTLSKDETELLIVRLVTDGYLAGLFSETAYATNTYAQAGPQAGRLLRHTSEDSLTASGFSISMTFLRSGTGKGKRKATTKPKASGGSSKKRKKAASPDDDEMDALRALDDDDDDHGLPPARPVHELSDSD